MDNPLGDSPVDESNPLGDAEVGGDVAVAEANPLGDTPEQGIEVSALGSMTKLPVGMTKLDAEFFIQAGQKSLGSFAENRLAPAAEGAMAPAVKIPEIKDLVVPGHQLQADVGVALYNGLKVIPESLTAPLTSVFIPLGLTASVSPIAKALGGAAAAYFAGDMAKAGGAEAVDAVSVLNDPKATNQQKLSSIAKAATTLGLSAAIGVHVGRGLTDQKVKLEVNGPDGPIEVETTAAQAAKRVDDHVANVAKEGEAQLDSIYKQAGVERPTDVSPETAAREKLNADLAKNPLGDAEVVDEPFVSATAEALKPSEPEVQFTIFPPEPHPMTGEPVPSYVQIETKTNQGRGEPLTYAEKTVYPTAAEVLESGLTKGQYTLEQVRDAIEKKKAAPPPEQVVEQGFVTSLKNAVSDEEAAAHGFPPVPESEKRTFQAAAERARKIVEDDATAPERLLAELADEARPMDDTEVALLLRRKVELEHEFNAVSERVASGTGDVDFNEAEVARISDELQDFNTITKRAKTESGVALNALKMNMSEDFSLARMTTERRARRGGERLPTEELAKTVKLSGELEGLRDEFQEFRRRSSELLQEPPKGPPAAPRRSAVSRLVAALEPRKNAALERIKARLSGGQLSAGIDPALLKDMAEVGAYHIAKGAEAFEAWSVEMIKDLGKLADKVKPHLREVFEASQTAHEAAVANDPKLKAAKTRVTNRIAELERRMKEGDYSKVERRKVLVDEELNKLQAEYEQKQAEYAAMLDKDRYDRLSAIGKLREQGVNTYDAARNIMTTGEFSFIARQGGFTAAANPIITLRALPDTFRAFISSETGARAIDLSVLNDPLAPNARAAKLHLVEAGAKLSRQEEVFASKWAEKIWGLRNFNQAGRVFLNRIRLDVFKQMREGLGDNPTPARERQIAMGINEMTGRGGLGKAEGAAVILGRGFFSPRFTASRIQLAVGHSMWGGDFATRRVIAKQYAKALISLGAFYAITDAALTAHGKKHSVELDPRSSDFGKIKIGNTRLDPLAGVAQVVVFGARTATLSRKTAKGSIQSLQGARFGQPQWTDVAANFARSKLHPIPGAVVNLFNGTDLGGNPADIENQSLNFVTPMTYADIYQALNEQDLPEGTVVSLLAMLGMGLQTYDANKKRPKPQKQLKPNPASK